MNKKGQAAIFIVVALFLFGAIVLVALLKDKEAPQLEVKDCEIDADCFPSECCNAVTCVPKGKQPNCVIDYENGTIEDVVCAPTCYSKTPSGDFKLGCGYPPESRGFCTCVNNKCVAEMP